MVVLPAGLERPVPERARRVRRRCRPGLPGPAGRTRSRWRSRAPRGGLGRRSIDDDRAPVVIHIAVRWRLAVATLRPCRGPPCRLDRYLGSTIIRVVVVGAATTRWLRTPRDAPPRPGSTAERRVGRLRRGRHPRRLTGAPEAVAALAVRLAASVPALEAALAEGSVGVRLRRRAGGYPHRDPGVFETSLDPTPAHLPRLPPWGGSGSSANRRSACAPRCPSDKGSPLPNSGA